jgi:hypothetical protein
VCGITKGVFSEFAPTIFSHPYNSYATLAIHSTIVNYKFRTSISQEEEIPDTNQFLQLAHYFFSNKDGSIPKMISPSKANSIYEKHVGLLREILEEIKLKLQKSKSLHDRSNVPLVLY